MAINLRPTDKLAVMRTVGVNTFMKLPLVTDLNELDPNDKVDYAIVGIPDDHGASMRVGQRFAPNKIREMSAMCRAINMEIGTNIQEELLGFDYGDVPVDAWECHETVNRSAEYIKPLCDRGIIPVTMGGDHYITMGPIRAVAQSLGKPMGLIHFDSHLDTYEEGYVSEFNDGKYNNGTTIRRAIEGGSLDPKKIVSIGIKGTLFNEYCYGDMSRDLGITIITMEDYKKMGGQAVVEKVKEVIGDDPCYLTFDIDCMDPAYCPGGAVYELGGFTTREIMEMLMGLKYMNIIGFDVAEVCPQYDVGDITSFTAASFMHFFLAMIGARKRRLAGKE